jgi:hypothetical protein
MIKTKYQSNPNFKILQLKENKSILKTLYAGYTQNIIKATIKDIYRWPLVLFFNDFYGKYVSKAKGIHKICTGLSLAAVESFIICPLERIKVFIFYFLGFENDCQFQKPKTNF